MADSEAAEAESADGSETPAHPLCYGVWNDALERHARNRGQAPAITHRQSDGRYATVTYAALLTKAHAYARLFVETTDPAQVIPMCLSRGAECVAALLGALMSGRAFCCINQKLRLPQIETILARLDSPIALIDGLGFLSLRGERDPGSPAQATTWYVVPGLPLARAAKRVQEELAAQTTVISLDATEQLEERAMSVLEPLLSEAEDERALGCCLFTSGSTGMPKGVLIGRDDLRARAEVEAAWLGLSDRDVLLSLLPFSFDVGLNQLLSTILIGAELVVLESWLPADILNAVAARGVTGIAAVPTIWADFLAHQRSFDRTGAHRSLRYLTISGGDLSAAQHAQLPQLAPGVEIYKTYGQTEAFRITSLRPEEYASRPLSVGRALPGGRLYVARPDGTRADPGEVGEVVHSGVGAMLAYLSSGAEEESKLRWNPWHGEDDKRALAVFTGDNGYVDEEGFLFLQGRRDDLVKIHGNRVYPSEVTGLLTTLPGVAAAEVVAVSFEQRTRLAAFVISRADAVLESESLRRKLAERAPSYMVPELLFVETDLPRTASGKPDRAGLTARALEVLKQGVTALLPLLSIELPTWI